MDVPQRTVPPRSLALAVGLALAPSSQLQAAMLSWNLSDSQDFFLTLLIGTLFGFWLIPLAIWRCLRFGVRVFQWLLHGDSHWIGDFYLPRDPEGMLLTRRSFERIVFDDFRAFFQAGLVVLVVAFLAWPYRRELSVILGLSLFGLFDSLVWLLQAPRSQSGASPSPAAPQKRELPLTGIAASLLLLLGAIAYYRPPSRPTTANLSPAARQDLARRWCYEMRAMLYHELAAGRPIGAGESVDKGLGSLTSAYLTRLWKQREGRDLGADLDPADLDPNCVLHDLFHYQNMELALDSRALPDPWCKTHPENRGVPGSSFFHEAPRSPLSGP